MPHHQQPGQSPEGQTGRAALGVAIGIDDQGDEGVRVASVDPNSAAARAGLRDGDRITAIDGKPIRSSQDLVSEIRRRQPGSSVKIAVVRDGRQESLTATLTTGTQRAHSQAAAPGAPALASPPRPMPGHGGAWLGIMLEPGENGTRVLDVFPNGPAAQAGVRAGDTLVSIHQKRVTSPDDARQALEGLQPQQRVEIVVNRNGQENRLTATLGRPEQMAQFQGPMDAPGMAMPGQASPDGDQVEDLLRQVLKEVQDMRQEMRELRSQSGGSAASRPSTSPPSQR